jgi:hypothetical protein
MLRISLIVFSLFLTACSRNTEKNITIMQLQQMADIATVEFTISKIIQASDRPAWYKYGERKILISIKARIKAGVDMSQMHDNDISISGNSVKMQLPRAHIISLNIDPESIKEEYSRTGFFRSSFSNQERYDFLLQAENQIIEAIDEMGILVTAENNAILFFESWLRTSGFETIEVIIKK